MLLRPRNAPQDPALRRAWLTFVIVGAGPTGVELAGALGEIARHTLKHDFRSIRPEDAQIFLLDGSSHVLPAYPEDLAADAERSLIRLGVQVRTGRASGGSRCEQRHVPQPSGRIRKA